MVKTIRKRQREGIEAAKEKGKHLGRPKWQFPDDFEDVYHKWKIKKEITARKAMKQLGLPKNSFYELVKK